jgi:hypothetical protein
MLLTLTAGTTTALAQTPPDTPYYARTNAFGIFSAYSFDSSHILLGIAQNRRLLDFGASYSRRLYLNRIVNWQYDGELLPVALESDPVVHTVYKQTTPVEGTYSENIRQTAACVAASGSYQYVYPGMTFSGTYVRTCTRQWNMGEAISPVGMQWNFLPRRKIQPFFIGHGGYMFSTQPIPVPNAGSFNFTFDLGAGVELYRSKTRSVRAGYRYHHISNHETAVTNPGIDNGLFQVTYAFGR